MGIRDKRVLSIIKGMLKALYIDNELHSITKDQEWSLNSLCAVLDPDDVEDDAGEESKFAISNNSQVNENDFINIICRL